MTAAGATTKEKREVIVQLNTDGSLPYGESQPGDVLATFSDNVFGSWIKMVAPGQYDSDLVDFKFSDDFRSLEFNVKLNAQFHDGTQITADDIQFSILRGLYTDKASFYAGFLGCIEGISETTRLTPGQTVQGIKITSRSQLSLIFRRPCPEILHALTLPYVAPRSRAHLRDDLVHFNELPVGAGPYRVVSEDRTAGRTRIERMAGESESVRVYELYTKKPPMTPDISLNRSADEYKKDMSHQASANPSTTLTLFSAKKNKLFATPRVRALFYQVFDRSRIAQGSESQAYSLSLFGGTTAIADDRREQARQELKGLLSNLPQADRAIKVALFGSIDERRKQLITDLKAQFASVGLTAEFELAPKKFLTEEDGDVYAFWLASLVIDPLAAGTMLSSWRDGSAFPFHSVPSGELTRLFLNWENSTSEADKKAAAIALDDFITSNGFGIPLLRGYNTIYYNPKTVKSLGNQNQILSVDLTEIRSSLCSKALEP